MLDYVGTCYLSYVLLDEDITILMEQIKKTAKVYELPTHFEISGRDMIKTIRPLIGILIPFLFITLILFGCSIIQFTNKGLWPSIYLLVTSFVITYFSVSIFSEITRKQFIKAFNENFEEWLVMFNQ